MRLPSVEVLLTSAARTLQRFPATLVSALVATIAGYRLVGTDGQHGLRLLLMALLGIPLFTALAFTSERRRSTTAVRILVVAAGAGVLASYFLAWPDWTDPVRASRSVQLAVAFHLMVAVLPWLGDRQLNGFWQFNLALFTRFLTAALYSFVLVLGLALALGAIDKLLGVDVSGDTYVRLVLTVGILFNTWFFLAGVPERLDALEGESAYPPGLKPFAQYVLIPIVVVYIAILTTYMIKIIVTRVWPSGWIGWLVSCVAVVGILALLLVYPIATRKENRWISTFARGFYLALLPSLGMLWLAIGKRIGQYGVTEQRYFLAVLSLWLTGIALYYGIRRSQDIRLIPASLLGLALITFAGPWGAYRVSERSQRHRLVTILERNAMLEDGTVRKPAAPVSFEDRREIAATLRYLTGTHGLDAVQPLFNDTLRVTDSLPVRRTGDYHAQAIMAALGLDYVQRYEMPGEGRLSWNVAAPRGPVDLAGFTWLTPLERARRDTARVAPGMVAAWDSATSSYHLLRDGALVLRLPVDSIVTDLRASGFPRPDTSRTDLRVRRSSAGVTAELRITDLNVREGDPPVVDWIAGWLLVEDAGPP